MNDTAGPARDHLGKLHLIPGGATSEKPHGGVSVGNGGERERHQEAMSKRWGCWLKSFFLQNRIKSPCCELLVILIMPHA